MTYNVIEELIKLRITLPFTKVVKIPQERENFLKLLDGPSERVEVVVTSPKQSQNQSTAKLGGKIPPFYISIENHVVLLHNCLVDIGMKRKYHAIGGHRGTGYELHQVLRN
jgi:hypothetical protein